MANASASPYSFSSVIGFLNANFGVILIAGLFFVGGFVSGSLWTENQMLKSGKTTAKVAAPAADAAAPAADAGPTAAQLSAMPEITNEDHIRGKKDAKVVLVEYSDFECPFCARFHPTMVDIKKEFGDDVAWVYRHFPLSFHPQAQPSAEMSECVAEMGGEDAYWKFVDAIFATNTKNNAITKEDILDAAQTAGVDRTKAGECMDSGKMKEVVQQQYDGGAAAGVSGTPGTIIVTKDGAQELISGALPLEQVKAAVQKYL